MQVSDTGMLERGDRGWRYRRCGGGGGDNGPEPRRCPRAGPSPVLGGAGLGTSCVHRGGHGGGREVARVCVPWVPAGAGFAPRPGVRIRVPGSGAGTAGRRTDSGAGHCPSRGVWLRALLSFGPSGADPAASTALLWPGVFPLLISSPVPLRHSPAFPRSPSSPCGKDNLQPGGATVRGWGPGHPRLADSPSQGLGLSGAEASAELHPDVGAVLLPSVAKQMS